MKYIKFYLNFSLVFGVCVLRGVAETFAITLAGFDVRDDSIAAKYLPAFLENPGVCGLEGSASAYYVRKKREAETDLQTHFPEGDPSASLYTFIRNSNYEDRLHKVLAAVCRLSILSQKVRKKPSNGSSVLSKIFKQDFFKEFVVPVGGFCAFV